RHGGWPKVPAAESGSRVVGLAHHSTQATAHTPPARVNEFSMTEQFETRSKKGRGMAQRSLHLIDAMYAAAEAAQPITGRGVGYKLFIAGLIPSMAKNEMQRVYRLRSCFRYASGLCPPLRLSANILRKRCYFRRTARNQQHQHRLMASRTGCATVRDPCISGTSAVRRCGTMRHGT